jgi:hypothetical protein
MSSSNEGLKLLAAEENLDIHDLREPIREAIDTPLDAAETLAIRFPRIIRPGRAPRAPEGAKSTKGKKKDSTEPPHVHGKGVHGRAAKHADDMAAILGGSYSMGGRLWDTGRGLAFDAALIWGLLVLLPAGLTLSIWTIGGLAIITKFSPVLGAFMRSALLRGVRGLTQLMGKKYFESRKDKSKTAWFFWNVLDGMEEFSRVVDDITDRAIQLIPFGIGDRILKWRQRAEAMLGSKPDPRREAVRKELDSWSIFKWLGTTSST